MTRGPYNIVLRHGTLNCYQYHGCRCRRCCVAASDYQKSLYARRSTSRSKLHNPRGTVLRCGTHAAYNRGCRCRDCTDAHAEYVATYRHRNPSASETEKKSRQEEVERDRVRREILRGLGKGKG